MRSEVTWPTIPAMVRDAARARGRCGGGRRRRPAHRLHNAARAWSTTPRVRSSCRASSGAIASRCGRRTRSEWIVAALGVTTAGGVLVPINTRFKGAEAAYVLARSGARALFTVRGFLDTDYPALLRERGRRAAGARAHDPALGVKPHEPRSRGTTSSARGDDGDRRRCSTRRSTSIGPTIRATSCSRRARPAARRACVMTHGQTLRAYLDWCDWAGLRAGRPLPDREPVLPHLRLQGRLPRVPACAARRSSRSRCSTRARCSRSSQRERITVLPGPPTLLPRRCSNIPTARPPTSRACGSAVTGAADIPVELIRRVREELPFETHPHRLRAHRGAARSRVPPRRRLRDTSRRPSGVPWPGFEVRIVDDDRRESPRGEPGEVVVRGDTVMRGYLDDPEATAAAIDGDGWLHTGDLGDDRRRRLPADRRPDQGHVHRRRVQRVPGRDREPACSAIRAIAQVAVIGVPDERLGEVGMAFVVLRPGPAVEAAEIVEWARARDGELQSAASGRVPRRAAGERHRQGREGRAPRAATRGSSVMARYRSPKASSRADRRAAVDRQPVRRVRHRHFSRAGVVPALRGD